MSIKSKLALLVIATSGILVISLSNCGDKKETVRSPRIRKLSKVTSPKNGLKIKLNEPFNFEVVPSQDTVGIDSFLVKMGTELVYSSSNPEKVNYTFNKTGKHRLTYSVFLKNGKREIHNVGLTFLSDEEPIRYTYRKVNTYSHDPDAYIQGLFYKNDFLFESTGHKGESTLRKIEISSGKVLQKIELDEQYFGEGITMIGDEIFMLTWQERKGFVFNKNDFTQLREFEYPTEGWGITTVGDSLVMSIGSHELLFMDPASFTEIDKLQVYDDNGPVGPLNELEYINGDIYANIYQTDNIAIIDPQTGKVKGVINLSGIFNKQNYSRRTDVLNGIAYDKERDRLFVTGKWWPKLYEIDLVTFEKTTIQ